MKKLAKLLVIIMLVAGSSLVAQAQNPLKVGYIDFNSLLAEMPGIDSIKVKLQGYQKTLTDQMDAMKAEFENKYLDYQSQSTSMSDLIRQTKEKELTDLQGRIEAFQNKASQDLQVRQQELVEPFISRAKKAISDVAKEQKYTLVLNSIEDVILYKDDSDDMLPLVKKKLGIQ